jgi:DNA polymerase-3 subunit alpha (Gram-positive type)
MPDETNKALTKSQIIKISLNHKERNMLIQINSDVLYTINEIDNLSEGYRSRLGFDYDVQISYMDVIEQLDRDMLIGNILYLLKKLHNSLAKEIDVECISLIDDSQISITVKNRILYEKMIQNKTEQKISQVFKSLYKYGIQLTLDFKEQVSHLDLSKELEKIVRETSLSNTPVQKKATTKIKKNEEEILFGKKINDTPVDINDINEVEGLEYCIKGEILNTMVKEIKKDLHLFQMDLTDYTNSITVKSFIRGEDKTSKLKSLTIGDVVIVKGKNIYDSFSKENLIMAQSVNRYKDRQITLDLSEEKRVELHVHSKMSALDGISDFDKIARRAKEWGHKAIALTDHGVLQGFPEAMNTAKKHGIKVIYGMEGYLCEDGIDIIKNPIDQDFNGEIVVFDLETTGLSPISDRIIEIGAVKLKNLEVIDTFNILINPNIDIPYKITQITGITNEDVKDAQEIGNGMEDFLRFIGDCEVLCAHNANFDYSFLRNNMDIPREFCVIDTLDLSRYLIKKRKSYKLNKLCKDLGIALENHHRASDDALAAARLLIMLIEMLQSKGLDNIIEINTGIGEEKSITNTKTYHIIILVKNYVGLKNLYKLVSESHLNYFYKKPLLPRSVLNHYREGLILGTACQSGELFSAILSGAPDFELDKIAQQYDFLEIQPSGNNLNLVKSGILKDENDLVEINKKIIELGTKNNKLVCATGDVHFLDKKDSIVREILMTGQGYDDANEQPSIYFKTTTEMLAEFEYLNETVRNEVIIKNPNLITDMIEDIQPIPDGVYPPIIEGADISLREITVQNANKKYGNPLPEIVQERLDRELHSIIGNGYAVMYVIAGKLVEKSLQDGYIVGSRGSVGSSFAATMSNITEVNPLPPHYICPECRHSEFKTDGSYDSGVDMPSKSCPQCGTLYMKDGHDIPFEVFLGFEGDKEPDIDLNFAAKEQIEAMRYTEALFGEGYVYRAGTIGTLASKTAYGFVKNFFDNKDIRLRNAETNRLVDYCTGVKKTTGQHPGGVMIVPKNKEIYDFTPIQYPANNRKSGVKTTHFDYHSISGRILKLDILGHDTPTIIKMLEDMTGFNSSDVPLDDVATLSLFDSPRVLKVTSDEIGCDTGTLGVPEFGTGFVRQMLMETKPKTFSDLVRISGLSHGESVWVGNAQDYIRSNQTTIKHVISTRDDIMTFLIYQGLDKKKSFDIMERVRKGKGVTEEDIDEMKQKNVPQWYIDSCNKIKYMFPKAHAVAYVTMSVKIAYYKVHFPLAFYAAYFTMKAPDFDADLIIKGKKHIQNAIKEIDNKENKSQKDKNSVVVLEVALEMYARGFEILPVDLYLSDHKEFRIKDNKLLPPLISLEGVGETAAANIQLERSVSRFMSVEDLMKRAKVNKTSIEVLKTHGCLDGLNESNQISLFNI